MPARIGLVARLDAHYQISAGLVRGTAVLLTCPDLALAVRALACRPLDFPYVPGLLSFREAPALRAALLLVIVSGPALAETKYFPERRALCLDCHGENGVSPNPETPSLGGMPEYYALLQLVEFRDGNRSDEIMRGIVHDMTDDDLRPPAPQGMGDPERMQRGAILVSKGRCDICHGRQLLGGEQMPPLRHQREDYLLKALRDCKAGRRLGDRAAMVEVVTPLSDDDLADLAHYLAHVRE